MSGMYNRFEHFPRNHVTITPSDSADLANDMIVIAATAGTIAARDRAGRDRTYTVLAGDILPILAIRILATGTTATVFGVY